MRSLPPNRQAQICECGKQGFVALTRGFVATFDPADIASVADMPWTLWTTPSGKVYAGRKGNVLMHRVLTDAPKGSVVDHINGDTLNNTKANLRVCSHSQNLWNAVAKNTALPKGVHLRKGGGFRAGIMAHGKAHYLGVFHTPEEAARAYDAAALELHGAFARTNQQMGLL